MGNDVQEELYSIGDLVADNHRGGMGIITRVHEKYFPFHFINTDEFKTIVKWGSATNAYSVFWFIGPSTLMNHYEEEFCPGGTLRGYGKEE